MNGAFTNHQRNPPYRKSRGQVVLEAFSYADAQSFIAQYHFNGIEPFTLIWLMRDKIQEVRWDGKKRFLSELTADQSHIWSSATLYNTGAQSTRAAWFEEWLASNPDSFDTLNFHQQSHVEQPEIAIYMQRKGGLQTVSIAKVEISVNDVIFTYQDLLTGQTQQETLAKSDVSKMVD